MGQDNRIARTRRHAYRTKTNRTVSVKTSGIAMFMLIN